MRDGAELAVIVTGGRDYRDAAAVSRFLDAARPELVIEGGAHGADALGAEWARANGVPCLHWPALWDLRGRHAGIIRNREMAQFGARLGGVGWRVLVAAFPGGRGTANMVAVSRELGLAVALAGGGEEEEA